MLNPKCITMGELYGEFSELTQEWHDGLASTIMRRAVADEGEHRRWAVGVSSGVFFTVSVPNVHVFLDALAHIKSSSTM